MFYFEKKVWNERANFQIRHHVTFLRQAFEDDLEIFKSFRKERRVVLKETKREPLENQVQNTDSWIFVQHKVLPKPSVQNASN